MFHLAGSWRWIYVIGAATALYLNVFVLVVQSFMKVPALKALAPTQTEPPFLVAQSVVLIVYLGLTVLATKRFHIEPARAA
jgi:predicted neutral ceramidase superfamily lipid hydrolase